MPRGEEDQRSVWGRRRLLALAVTIVTAAGGVWGLVSIITSLSIGEGHGTAYWGAIFMLVLLVIGLFYVCARSCSVLRKY